MTSSLHQWPPWGHHLRIISWSCRRSCIKITFEEIVSQSALKGKRFRFQPPASMFHWDSCRPAPLPTLFPSKTVLAEKNFGSWSQDMSPPSPQVASFSDYSTFPADTCLCTCWLMSSSSWTELEFGNKPLPRPAELGLAFQKDLQQFKFTFSMRGTALIHSNFSFCSTSPGYSSRILVNLRSWFATQHVEIKRCQCSNVEGRQAGGKGQIKGEERCP